MIGQLKEENNVQVDCCGWLRLVDCNIGARYDTCAASPAERHGNSSCCRLRPGQDPSQRCMRGTDYRPPDAPNRPQMGAMAGGRFRFLQGNAPTRARDITTSTP